jgi:DNA-binding GntR family transcriptional regulator
MENEINLQIEKFSIKSNNIQSLRDFALEFLREAIISGHYKPGDQIKEREVAEILNISTTPVKEALRVLSHEGLVESLPRRGAFVSKLVNTSIEDFMMLKCSLESLAAKFAAIRGTDQEIEQLGKHIKIMKNGVIEKNSLLLTEENTRFHRDIWNMSKHEMLHQFLNNLRSYDYAFRKRSLKINDELENGYLDHEKIYEAIKDRNPELAEAQMKAHILRSVKNVLATEF